MTSYELDAVDRGILALLERNARDITYQEIADQLDVAATTVRNRIDRLEATNVIKGYHPEIDYEAGGWPIHVLIICTMPRSQDDLVERALDIQGVIAVHELLMGNLHIEIVTTNMHEMTRIVNALHDIKLQTVDLEFMADCHYQPSNHLELPTSR